MRDEQTSRAPLQPQLQQQQQLQQAQQQQQQQEQQEEQVQRMEQVKQHFVQKAKDRVEDTPANDKGTES